MLVTWPRTTSHLPIRRNSVRRLLRVLPLLLALTAPPAFAGTVRVEAQGNLVTATLDAAPVAEVVEATRKATGVEVVLPASTQGKVVTLAVEQVPLEQFVRRLLQALDLGGFVLVYESTGVANRLIVVDRGRPGPPPDGGARPPGEPTAPPAASVAPVYIPPREPPVYIPPTIPPVYIPPTTPPVYIPPTIPPVYIPPAVPPVYVPPTTPSQ